MKIKSSVLFLLSSVFLVSCDVWAAEDPLAGEPDGERVALWPEGKVPGVEGHQYNSPFIEWFTPSNKTTMNGKVRNNYFRRNYNNFGLYSEINYGTLQFGKSEQAESGTLKCI